MEGAECQNSGAKRRVLGFLLRHAQFLQLGGNVRAVVGSFDFIVDRENLAVFANVKRHARGGLFLGWEHPVSLCRIASWVAQDGVVGVERFGEFLVLLGRVAAYRKVYRIVFLQIGAVGAHGLAFGGAAGREGLGIPSQDDSFLAFVVGKLMGFAVASFQGEIRRGVAFLQWICACATNAKKCKCC